MLIRMPCLSNTSVNASLVLPPAVLAAPLIFLVLLGGEVVSKIFGLYPVVGRFRQESKDRWYYTLMMSTGLIFGTISSLYGFYHGIINREQYSFLVAVVIASAVIPILIANYAFLPQDTCCRKKRPPRRKRSKPGIVRYERICRPATFFLPSFLKKPAIIEAQSVRARHKCEENKGDERKDKRKRRPLP